MDAQAVLDQARQLGIELRADGDSIRYRPKSAAPEEFVKALRRHKAEIMAVLCSKPAKDNRRASAPRLVKALSQKKQELALMERCLAYPYYANDEWTKKQIVYLQAHIAEIQRFLREGGDLKLPRCCRQAEYTCLVAMKGFDQCIMTSSECGFSLMQ